MIDYREDLAWIHDAGFSGFALHSATGVLALLRRNGIDGGLVVDLGCGSGVWARHLGFAGYDVVGVDISPAMIRLARRKAPKATFVKASFADMQLPQCAAVTSIGEPISYAFADDRADRGLLRLFRRVRRALRPGGVFIFDFARPGREPGGMPKKSYWTGHDWAVLVEKAEDTAAGVLTRRIITFRHVGRCWRRGEETHRVRLYRVDEIRDLLARAGFDSTVLRGYGDVRFRSGHAGVVARRPATAL